MARELLFAVFVKACLLVSLPPLRFSSFAHEPAAPVFLFPSAQAKSKAKIGRKDGSAGGAEARPQPGMIAWSMLCGKFPFLSAAPLLTPCVGKRADSSNSALGHQCVHVSKRFGG